MADKYAHPVGVASEHMAKAAVDLREQADAARTAGDDDKAYALEELAKQHTKVASELDVAEQLYRGKQTL